MPDHDTHDHTGVPGVGGTPDAEDVVFDPTGLDNTAATDVQAALEDYDAAITAASGGGGLSSGTSNPGSPSTGDLFWRTDLRLMIFYDGTRWLTTDLKIATGMGDQFQGNNGSGGVIARIPIWSNDYDLWVEKFYWGAYVASTNNGSNYWIATFSRVSAPNSNTSLGTVNTSTGTADNYTAYESSAIDTLVAKAATNAMIIVETSKNGGPGNIYWVTPAVAYRLVVP